ncbi:MULTISPECIES: H-NS family nucleoid-associated regulatory protein [Buttiauxella]|jgi:DNA-binding protein StpA|uniref:H-NS family histone-like protein n=1 Tax=Enterobacterales TaxID=91347 RepID=UPI0010653049|nr:H-NS family nucleoid-associated regulatory protein [Buttiauxella sp. BIGb0552]TDX12001.1 nucleoid protein StpA [Buttiauxella sp. BIGb0552]
MSEAIKSLNNIRTLRAQARELPLEVLEEVLEKLTVVVEERREEDSAKQAEIEERNQKLQTFRQMMEDEGINPEDLLGVFTAKSDKVKKVREPRPAKYKYTNEDGETKTWTGQGRTPKALAKQLAAGKSLDEFLI